MKEFDELGFSEFEIKFLEEHGLDTDRHMTTHEEVQKLFDGVLDMTKDELHEVMDRYIHMPPMPEIVNSAVYVEYARCSIGTRLWRSWPKKATGRSSSCVWAGYMS